MAQENFDEKEFTLEDIVSFVTNHWRTMLVFTLVCASFAAVRYKTSVSFTSKSILLFQKQGSSPLQTITANFTGVNMDNYWSEDKLEHHRLFLESPSFYRKFAGSIVLDPKYNQLIKDYMGDDFFDYLLQAEGTEKYEHRLEQITEKLAIFLWGGSKIQEVGPNSIAVSVSYPSKSLSVDLANLVADQAVEQISKQFISEVDEVEGFLKRQIEEAEKEMTVMDEMIITLQDRISDGFSSGKEMSLAEVQVGIKEELANTKIERFENKRLLQEMKTRFPANEPGRDPLTSNKFSRNAKVALLEEENKLLDAKIGAMEELIADLESSRSDRSKIEISIERLKRKIEFKSQFIMELVSKTVRLQVMKISLQNKVSVLERAQLARASRDGDLKKSLAGASGVGLILAIFFVLIRSVFSPIIHSEKDFQHLKMLPVGRIPNFSLTLKRFDIRQGMQFFWLDVIWLFAPLMRLGRKKNPLYRKYLQYKKLSEARSSVYVGNGVENVFLSKDIEKESLNSAEAQAFRSLRVRYLSNSFSSKYGGNVISVVSPSVGAGKSYVSANFAGSLAHLGKKTLLVDCDMRSPAASQMCRANSRHGLIDILESGDMSLMDKYVKTLSVGLDVLPSGRYHNRVPELLSSAKMIDFMEDMKTKYDYIIMDLPPMAKVAESVFLTKLSNFVLMITTLGHSKLNDLESTLGILRANGQLRVGSVVNKAGHPSEFYYTATPQVTKRQAS